MASLVGEDEARDLFFRGYERFPDDDRIRYGLGLAHLRHARRLGAKIATQDDGTVTEEQVLEAFRGALVELLRLHVERPQINDVLVRLREIATRFRSRPEDFVTLVRGVFQTVFPGCGADDWDFLAKTWAAFVRKDFSSVTTTWEEDGLSRDLKGATAFSNLFAGMAYLELADSDKRKFNAVNIEISGINSRAAIASRMSELARKARGCFDAGIAADAGNISLELQRMRLNLLEVLHSELSVDTLLPEIRTLADKNRKNPEAQFVLASALDQQWNEQLEAGQKAKLVYPILVEERNCLRRALVSSPHFVDAYLLLAATYVTGWHRGELAKSRTFADPSRKLFAPAFDKAVTILKSAPLSPIVLQRVARYYEAYGKHEDSLEYLRLLFRLKPVEGSLNQVIRSYAKLKRFEEARTWLLSLKETDVIAADFETTRLSGLALIAAEDVKDGGKTDFEKKKLWDDQIRYYRLIRARAEEQGFQCPAYVVNNLAYMLTEHGNDTDVRRAIEMIEEVLERFTDGDRLLSMGTVSDIKETYAWANYRAGELEKAQEIYRSLASDGQLKPGAEFYYHYAKVLFDLREFERAAEQLSLLLDASDQSDDRLVRVEALKLNGRIEIELQQRFERSTEFLR